jgi:hypothetical protein
MTKWEYCQVDQDSITYYTTHGVRSEPLPHGLPQYHDTLAVVARLGTYAAVAKLGLEGWEMVAALEKGATILKRPIQD